MQSRKYNLVKKYYDKGLWRIGAVRSAVEKGWITRMNFTKSPADPTRSKANNGRTGKRPRGRKVFAAD